MSPAVRTARTTGVTGATRLRVDWIACQGRGLCAELLPERIGLDEWGYPVLDGTPVGEDLLRHARAAAKACPTRALRLTEGDRR